MSLVLGAVSLIWHIANLILYFTNNDNSLNYSITDAMYGYSHLII